MRPNLPALKDAHHKIFYFTKDIKINGITVGRGAGNISLNTAVGASALSNNTTGSNNTAVGYNAGSTITSGSFNTFIGYNARGSAGTNTYEIAIGNNALGLGTNTTVIGTSGNTNSTTIYGALSLPDTTASTTTTTGALKVSGGVGIVENLNVGGNATITGNLTVNGTTTTVSTSTLTVSSSLILPNTTTLPASPATGNLRYNTTLNKFEGYSSVGWGSIGGGLTPTPVKTAAYTAVANDLVRCNTSGGAFSIMLPSSPADGDIVGILDTNNTFAVSNLTVLANGKTIEGDSSSVIIDINGAYISLIYVSATSNWKIQTLPSLSGSSTLQILNRNGTSITKITLTSSSITVLTHVGSTILVGIN